MIGLCLCMGLSTVQAQTNVTFQNCRAGDLVKVKCRRPLLVLSQATLLEIGRHTVTLCTDEDRFVLDQTNVVLLPLNRQSRPATGIPPARAALPPVSANFTNRAVKPAPAAPAGDLQKTMEAIRASIIDPHKMEAYKEPKMVNGKWVMVVNPNSTNGAARYQQANDYYRRTMNGVLNGSITQADLVHQAKEVLAQCDKYKSERAADPQYEKEIETLRDFVRRSEAGEKIDFGTPVQ